MADNVTADPGSGGSTFAAPELTFSGDTVKLPLSSLGILSGSEGAWTFTLYTGGAGAVSAGTPRVTLASDDPAVAALGSIKTAVETLDNAISGSEMQVDVVGALPAGTNAIGKLAANSGVDIGDVDVTSVPADPFGVNADAASATGSISAKLRFIASTGIPVTGTVTVGSHDVTNAGTFAVQAAQSGTWNVTNVSGTVSLPTGAATAAKQPALGTAGTASADVITVQGIASMTAIKVDGSAVTQPVSDGGSSITVDNGGTFAVQATVAAAATSIAKAEDAGHTTADVGVPALAVRRDSAAVGSDTDGDYSTLNVDSTGRLWCNVSNTVTVASHAVTNAGTFAVQVDGSALTALQLIDDPVFTDDNAFTPGTSKVVMGGFEADESSTDSVDEGDAGAARMTLDRKQIVTPQPHTAGGLSIFRSLDLDETEEDIKTSAGQLYGWYIFNASTSVRYVKFYNATAANVTVGTTTPVLTIPVPATTSGGVGMVFSVPGVHGIVFDTAITAAATTGLADNDTGAPAANDIVINALYK